MALPQRVIDLVTSFEGYHRALQDGSGRAAPYLCPANVPTIGWGATRYADGTRVAMTDTPITRDRADALLLWELATCERAVDILVRVPLHPLSRGALVSFAFNVGSGALKRSTLLRYVNAGRWGAVPAEFAKWRMGGGRVLAGQVRRRAAEAQMFVDGVVAGHSPQPVPPTPSHKPGADRPTADGWSLTDLLAATNRGERFNAFTHHR